MSLLLSFGLLAGLVAAASFASDAKPAQASAIFAGGCFWCEETAFEGVPGVLSVTSGYTGGQTKNPSYEQVSAGVTGHAESVQVVYDPGKISYARLLEIFWHNIDPYAQNAQFCDHGTQYRSAIFYQGDEQRRAAWASKAKLEEEPRFKDKIVTQVVAASKFYPAEEYHQDYYKKNPVHYQAYRLGCGRDRRLKDVWGDAAGGHSMSKNKASDEELQKKLTPLQYQVTQHEGTEPPFRNEYWDNHEAGLYVDVVSGEVLFSSLDKYDSGTGWPSFSQPLEKANVKTGTDFKLGLPRSEVRSTHANSHLGHVFPDGPAPTGLRYCMNSAAMRFIPVAKLAAEGYGKYLPLFEKAKR